MSEHAIRAYRARHQHRLPRCSQLLPPLAGIVSPDRDHAIAGASHQDFVVELVKAIQRSHWRKRIRHGRELVKEFWLIWAIVNDPNKTLSVCRYHVILEIIQQHS